MKKIFITTGLTALVSFLAITNSPAVTILTVPANPLWTYSGINLNSGDQVNVTASGTWEWTYTFGFQSPDGLSDPPNSFDRFFSGALNGELIAYVGLDPTQGHRGDGSFFPQSTGYWAIGSNGQFTSPTSGQLWLGINDDAVSADPGSDNFGSVDAQITVTPVPEPSTVSLAFLSGALGLAGVSFRNRARGSR